MSVPAVHCEAKKVAYRPHRFGPVPRDVIERLWEWSMPIPFSGCYVFLGNLDKDGYGIITLSGQKRRRVHRVAYELLIGPIPPGLGLDHKCRVRSCWNPAHAEPVTSLINTMRGEGLAPQNVAKTHCPQGHEYSDDNLYLNSGRRHCRICARERTRRYRLRKLGRLL